VIKGRAEEIKNMHEVLETMAFPLFPWHAGAQAPVRAGGAWRY
jgi:hypothetical protein